MHFDLTIVGGFVLDGTGSDARQADVGVRGGRIAVVGALGSATTDGTIRAEGRVVAPGFIDLHTHCLRAHSDNYLAQGVTTVVGGNCGFSAADLAKEGDRFGRHPIGPNLAMLAGHNTIRRAVLENRDRGPSDVDLERMQSLLREQMEAGAFGFSTGLQYPPGSYAGTEEVVALARTAAPYGGYYTSHMRDEGRYLEQAVEETLLVGRESGMPVHVSHLKAAGRAHWGKTAAVLALLDAAREGGDDVTQDAYPYAAACGPIGLLAPAWSEAGSPEEVRERLADAGARARFLDAVSEKLSEYYGGDLSLIRVTDCPGERALEGRRLSDLARDGGLDATSSEAGARLALDLLLRHPRHGAIMCALHMMDEADVGRVLDHPCTAVASDGWALNGGGHPHPRLIGTFPRVLGHYVRDEKRFGLSEAVRKMTTLPARRLGLADRGWLREGAWADVVVFDPARVADAASFETPRRRPAGVETVLINGRPAMLDGKLTGERPGVFLRRRPAKGRS